MFKTKLNNMFKVNTTEREVISTVCIIKDGKEISKTEVKFFTTVDAEDFCQTLSVLNPGCVVALRCQDWNHERRYVGTDFADRTVKQA